MHALGEKKKPQKLKTHAGLAGRVLLLGCWVWEALAETRGIGGGEAVQAGAGAPKALSPSQTRRLHTPSPRPRPGAQGRRCGSDGAKGELGGPGLEGGRLDPNRGFCRDPGHVTAWD